MPRTIRLAACGFDTKSTTMKTKSSDIPLTQFAALVGMDWGDQSHAIAIQTPNTPVETFTLDHSAENLHQWLDELEKRCGGKLVAVAIEASKGAVVYALLERPWIMVYPIHPATSARHRAAFRPSGAKDDTPDALVLLSLLQYHRQRLRPLQMDDEPTRTLARLVEARRKAVDRRSLLTNQLQSTLKDYFPQALELIGKNFWATLALDFLEKWPRLTDVQAAKNAAIKNFYHRHNVRRSELVEARLKRIREARLLTRDTAVIEVAVRVVRLLTAELRVVQEHVTGFEAAIAQDFRAHPEKNLFQNLPGAGAALAPRLLAAFGTFRNRFEDAASLQRYFGVAPVTEKSGGRMWVHWRWNAPVFLRQTLVEWAGLTVIYCPWAKAYYEQQRTKRAGHWAILRALAFKWLRILWRCWQRSEIYDEEKYLRQLEQRRSPIAAMARQFATQMTL
jgi:transposase